MAKQIIAKAAKGLHEYIGLIVVFSVDLFSVFYVAICTQTSKSITTTVLIIASDSFHLVIALRAIFQQVHGVKPADATESSSNSQSKIHFRDLPRMIRCVFGDSEVSNARSRRIRVFAPFPFPLSSKSVAFLTEIARAKRERHVYSSSAILLSGRTESVSRSRSSDRVGLKTGETKRHLARFVQILDASKQNQIAPASLATVLNAFGPEVAPESEPGLQMDRIFSSKTLFAALIHKGNEEAVWDALQALFHSEYLLMAEYVECALPLLYALYLSILYHLPIAQYYPHTASMTQEKLVSSLTNILLFGTVEFTTFVLLLLLLRKKFGVSPLYQLAFVLEIHAQTLQGHLFVWTIFILHLPLAHYGVDFNISLPR
ncbi:hypothetical protein V7S43_017349 [Phytophthora oleae]|uniref:Uncharacterized protein n=1 Tax=Phytophthora oleae TaxID=2107226 RepID=A0ABD3ETY6_9STRA